MTANASFRRLTALVLCLELLAACGARESATPPTEVAAIAAATPPPFAKARARLEGYRSIVDAPDRSADDRALDAGRHPLETLLFYDIQPGMQVAELAAGGGYTAELLARVVGPEGRVYGHNTPFILDRFAEQPWSERLRKPVMSNVVRVDREFDDPFPDNVRDLNAVFLVLFYHDTVWMKTDRAQMNRAVFDALRSGGIYAVIDHSAAPGHGVKDAERLHRIEESVVVSEIREAGFRLEKTATFLRNANDTRDWNASPRAAGERRGESDRFVLLFRKP